MFEAWLAEHVVEPVAGTHACKCDRNMLSVLPKKSLVVGRVVFDHHVPGAGPGDTDVASCVRSAHIFVGMQVWLVRLHRRRPYCNKVVHQSHAATPTLTALSNLEIKDESSTGSASAALTALLNLL